MSMNLAINTDYFEDVNSPEKYIRFAAEAGFSHLMWCHQWNTDFIYSKFEIDQIKSWLKSYNIALQDVHGTDGREKCWFAAEEYRRKSGVELVINRLIMLKELEGTGTLIMHPPRFNVSDTPEKTAATAKYAVSVRRSLDELLPVLEKYDARIALENLPHGNWKILSELLDRYPAERIGFCFDSGHCNITARTHYEESEKYASRIIAVHLHDNDGSGDQHQNPFTGTFDWEWLAGVMKKSGYSNLLNFEVSCRKSPFYNPEASDHDPDIRRFLADAMERCSRFAAMCGQ